MKAHHLDEISIGVISALPLFYAPVDIRHAILFGASVVIALLVFELLFSLVKHFWLRSLRTLLALIVLASVLELIFLVCRLFLPEPANETMGPTFSLTLISAFLLAHCTALGQKSFARRLRSWGVFLFLIFILGASRQWNTNFQAFLPGPFWVVACALAVFYFFRERVKL